MYTYNCNQSIYGEIQAGSEPVASYSINKDGVNPPTVSLTVNDKAKWEDNSEQCLADLAELVGRALS